MSGPQSPECGWPWGPTFFLAHKKSWASHPNFLLGQKNKLSPAFLLGQKKKLGLGQQGWGEVREGGI